MENKKMNVIVHKQKIQLANGESIGNFTQELSDAAGAHLRKKMNMANGQGHTWPIEIYADKVIMSAYKNDEASKIYQFSYTRKNDGSFDFGSTVEVERVTSFKPKTTVAISKSNASIPPKDEDWMPVAKNLWENIL